MNERIHKYFYEELSTEERLSLLRDVEAGLLRLLVRLCAALARHGGPAYFISFSVI